ncbi:MAG: type II CAAX endopeptidase family protein [Candidatus Brocadiia bacterium]
MRDGGFFKDTHGRLRTVWRFLIYGVALLILFVVIGLGLGVFVRVLLPAVGVEVPLEAGWLLTGIALPFHAAAVFGLTWLMRRFLDRRDLHSMGISKPEWAWSASPLVGLAIGAGAALLPVGALLAMGTLRPGGDGALLVPLVVLPVLVVAAFEEELIFRGYLLSNMLDIDRPVAGVILTSVIFAGIHALNPHFWDSPVNALNIGLAGLLLAVSRVLSKNLWFPTALHFGWNAVQGPLFGLPVSGIDMPGLLPLTTPGAAEGARSASAMARFGLESSPLATGVLLVAMVLLVLWFQQRRMAPNEPGAAGNRH